MSNPYESLEQKAFWRPAVGGRNVLEIENLWSPKFSIVKRQKVITAGSCFAQHIGKALAKNGFTWFDAEPGPVASSSEERALLHKNGYGVFSFRTGNIYTAALLKQWLAWAISPETQSSEIWETDGRFFDPQRPAIEPGGFSSREEALEMRAITLAAIRRAVTEASVFVFTMGLTEGWENSRTGVAYAMCPGTLAGEFNADEHLFINYRHRRIYNDMRDVLRMARTLNKNLRFLLTVSPVPLTATASGDHILVASMQSKSTLRSVAHELCEDFRGVDYFPSYEVISSPPFRGMFFQPNQREVSPKGVEHVMTYFFEGLASLGAGKPARLVPESAAGAPPVAAPSDDDIQCEEAMLEAFEK
ncbi:MAG: GSCFA domain-containing protein [Rhizobiaceae bacterium]|jgi:hypothetical protein|nr:GSCFA domain-containing protein [Rhizobiaceae bacterium]